MCYFHLKSNLRNQKSPKIGRIPIEEYQLVMSEIKDLHMSISQDEYENLKEKVLLRWRNNPHLISFHDCFVKKCLESYFSRWQILQTPAGYAKTNNPLEQYNNRIKEDFTKRAKHHIKFRSIFGIGRI